MTGILAAEAAGLPWQRAGLRAGWGSWMIAAFDLARLAAWAPAVLLLAFCRRWSDTPRA